MALRVLIVLLCALTLSCEQDGPLRDALETSKRSLEAAKDTRDRIKGQLESLKEEKAKIDREVAEKNQRYARDVDADVANAEVFITPEKGHLRCRLKPVKGPFKIIEQRAETRVAWFVDGEQVTRGQLECGVGAASLGVGLGGGGRDCDAIGGPPDPQGLYPYQVPQGAAADAEFVCRLYFPKTAKQAWRSLLARDLESLVKVSSSPVQWPGWRALRDQSAHQ